MPFSRQVCNRADHTAALRHVLPSEDLASSPHLFAFVRIALVIAALALLDVVHDGAEDAGIYSFQAAHGLP
jgi:hypothetical protein